MANDGTGAGWDTTDPADSAYASAGALQIRDVRAGVALRLNKEHTTCTTSTGGGEHKAGSCVIYPVADEAALPTKRPDTTTDLGADDEGRLAIAKDTELLYYWDGSAWQQCASGPSSQVAEGYVQLRQTTTGALTTGSWQKRNFATESVDTGNNAAFVVAGGGSFTLEAGTYRFRIKVAGYFCAKHMARLANTSDGTYTYGTSEYAPDAGAMTWSEVCGRIVLAAQKTFEIQHYCSVTRATNGQGVASTPDIPDISSCFGIAEFWKEVA